VPPPPSLVPTLSTGLRKVAGLVDHVRDDDNLELPGVVRVTLVASAGQLENWAAEVRISTAADSVAFTERRELAARTNLGQGHHHHGTGYQRARSSRVKIRPTVRGLS